MTQPVSQDLIDNFVGCAHGDFDQVAAMLNAHPSLLEAKASWDETALQAAAQTANRPIMELLLEHGAPMDICAAAALGRAPTVERFLDSHPDLANARGAHGLHVLFHAAMGGSLSVVELLLERGADGAADAAGPGSPLEGAVRSDSAPVAELLLTHGARAIAVDYEGKSLLACARELQYAGMESLLISRGAVE